MHLQLAELLKSAADLGLEARSPNAHTLELVLQDALLIFQNLAGDDNIIGFEGASSHLHDNLTLEMGSAEYITCEPLDILIGLAVGDLVVVSRLANGALQDRHLAHRQAPLSLKYLQPGEELRIFRLCTPV